jgi:hypothetical protein
MFDMWMEHHIDHVLDDFIDIMEQVPNITEFIASMNRGNPIKKANDKMINSLITHEYGSVEFKSYVEENNLKPLETCSICLTDFEEEETVKWTKCNHLFHDECISKWLKENISCPLCRCNSITGNSKEEESKCEDSTFEERNSNLEEED